jgi:DNA polymerase elongation subunit (family B)
MHRLYLFHASFSPNPLFDKEKRLKQSHAEYIIHLVCKDRDGRTIVIGASDWRPWLYIKANDEEKGNTKRFKASVMKELNWVGCESVEVVERVQFVGFTNLAKQQYARCRFKKWPAWHKDPHFKARFLEVNVKPVLKFFHESGLRSGAWFDYTGPWFTDNVITKQSLECNWSQCTPRPEDSTPPALTLMAYDLETSGLSPDKCKIHQVCLIFHSTKDGKVAPNDKRSIVICTQPTDAVNGTQIVEVQNEKELLKEMRAVIMREDPDIMTGYNLLIFDNAFINARMQKYTGMDDFRRLGRIEGTTSQFVNKQMGNAALGTNDLCLWDIPGRMVLDLYLYCKINFPGLEKYKLDFVGNMFIETGKVDMVYGKILESFSDEGTPALRGAVAHYW